MTCSRCRRNVHAPATRKVLSHMTPPPTSDVPANRYGPDLVIEALALEPLDALGGIRERAAARVVFLPSFHPEGAITASRRGVVTELQVSALSTSLWFRLSAGGAVRRDPNGWAERASLDGDDASELWDDLSRIELPEFPELASFGIDGISLHGEYVDSRVHRKFDAWSPGRATLPSTFVRRSIRQQRNTLVWRTPPSIWSSFTATSA